MTAAARHVVITGAAGFIGSRLASRLLGEADFADARVTLVDLRLEGPGSDPRVRCIEGDFGDERLLAEALDGHADVVFHLAGVLGGAAELDYSSARRVNIDATLTLFEALRRAARPPRIVYASSIAVFGPPLPDLIDDDTLPLPTMSYGAQKRMMEVALEQFSARGWLEGVALRLPGIVARRDADARLKSAFLNAVFHAFPMNRDLVLPVSPDGTIWLISVHACVEAFLHAARLPSAALGRRRAFTLPAQRVTIQGLVDALRRRFPASRTSIRFSPDPAIEAQFARYPELRTAMADALGFRHDGDIDTLVRRAME